MDNDEVHTLIYYEAQLRQYVSEGREEVITKITHAGYQIRSYATYRLITIESLDKLQQELQLIRKKLYEQTYTK